MGAERLVGRLLEEVDAAWWWLGLGRGRGYREKLKWRRQALLTDETREREGKEDLCDSQVFHHWKDSGAIS